MVMDKIYHLSQPDDEPLIRLYVPSYLSKEVLVQYHNYNSLHGREKDISHN